MVKKVLITGGKGFLGSHLVDRLNSLENYEILAPSKNNLNLLDLKSVKKVLEDYRPDIIIHLAAKVGGIGFLGKYPGKTFYENLIMGINLMEEARKNDVEKFISIGTTCSYPKYTPVPFDENDLWNGYPDEITGYYGLAKKMLMVQGSAYKKEYDFNSVYLILVNLYGPRDNFIGENAHVIPALIQKISDAKISDSKTVNIWGDGKATREFLYVGDATDAILLAMKNYNEPDPINIGTGIETSIKSLAEILKKIIGYQGELIYDASKPAGQPRRCLNVTRAKQKLGFTAKTDLVKGLKETVDWYMKNIQTES